MTTHRRSTADGGQIALLALATVGGMVALGLVASLTERLSAGPRGRVPALVPSLWRGHAAGSGARRPAGDTSVVDRPLASAGRVMTP
jgi:hypothetical protein